MLLHCAHVDAKMAHKGVKMFDISGAHAEIVIGSVLHHFYRTQVSLGSDLWVLISQTDSKTILRLN